MYLCSDGFFKTKVMIKNLNFPGCGDLFDRCLFRIYPSFQSSKIVQIVETRGTTMDPNETDG